LGLAGTLSVLAFPFFIILTNGHHHIESEQSYCPFKLATGLPCPGCGITKSLVFFYEGNLWKSLSYHVFGPLVVIAALFFSILLLADLLLKKDYIQHFLYKKHLGTILGVSLGIYHLIRLVHFIYTHTFDQIVAESAWG